APAHVGNNAERAAIVASVLNLEIRASAIAQGVFNRRGKKIALVENIADADLAVIVRAVGNEIRNQSLVRVSDYQTHARQGGDFLRRALSVATRDNDARVGLRAMNAADGLAKLV